MNSINEENIIVMTFIIILLIFWAVIIATPRHRYVSPVEYHQFEFNLDDWSFKRLRRIMHFIKKEIRLLIDYFDLKNIEYRERICLNSEFALYFLLCKLS